ncbi:MAG TPA: RNA polymerase sigma factor [Pyrinomonadaceae bacterium]|nr:RNA polymerase sigma factor [Pyrinomonadaceae bacterium]
MTLTHKDAELLQLISAGDEHVFAAFYQEHQAGLFRFGLLMSGSRQIAEEVVQEVFLALIREPHRYDPARGNLSSYLYGMARNHVLRSLRREKPYVPLVEPAEGEGTERLVTRDDPSTETARREAIKIVRQAVVALPVHYREVVVLCDFQEMTYAEAARILECPVGTVNSRLHRGHALMVQRLRASKISQASPDEEWTSLLRCFA